MLFRLLLEERQQIGVVADHFPLAVLFAEDVGGADGDLHGAAFGVLIAAFFDALREGEIVADSDAQFVGLDRTAELQRGL